MNLNPNGSKPVLVWAFGILLAFFMPWFQYWGRSFSGYYIGQQGSLWNLAWVIPILAGATILVSFTEMNNRNLGAFTGLVPLCALGYGLTYGLTTIPEGEFGKAIVMAMHVLSIGAWLTIIFSVAIIYSAIDLATNQVNWSYPPDSETAFPFPQDHLTPDVSIQGVYECPECLYLTLKRGASRCPKCQGGVSRAFWDSTFLREELEAEERAKKEKLAGEERARKKAIADEEWRKGEQELVLKKRRDPFTQLGIFYLTPIIICLLSPHLLEASALILSYIPGINWWICFGFIIKKPDLVIWVVGCILASIAIPKVILK